MDDDSTAGNVFRGQADLAIQAGSIHGGLHLHQPGGRADAKADVHADELRIAELYRKVTEQLGSDKAPVRLAGLYAAERCAQNNADHRQPAVRLLAHAPSTH